MNAFFFLEIGLDLRRGGAFIANAPEKGFQVGRRKRISRGDRGEEAEEEGEEEFIKHFQGVGRVAAKILRARTLVQPPPPRVK